MKIIAAVLSIAVLTGLSIGIGAPPGEAATRGAPQDLALLRISVALINEDARLSMNTQVAVKTHMADRFRLTLGKIDSLLGPGMPYGDLAAVLTFSQKMSGGTKDANINKVIDLRRSGLDWDQVAEKLRLELSGAARSLSRFEESTHSIVKQVLVESYSAGAAAGGAEQVPE